MKIKAKSRSIVLASAFLILFLICISSTALASATQVSNSASPDTAEPYTFVTKWGSYGSEDGQFNYPMGVAVDSSGNVYVTDYNNHRIQKFAQIETPISPAPIYNLENGHYYELINMPEGITWEDANNAAQSSPYLGMKGHLATITSEYKMNLLLTICIQITIG